MTLSYRGLQASKAHNCKHFYIIVIICLWHCFQQLSCVESRYLQLCARCIYNYVDMINSYALLTQVSDHTVYYGYVSFFRRPGQIGRGQLYRLSRRPFDSFSGTQREERAVLWSRASCTGTLRTKNRLSSKGHGISGSPFSVSAQLFQVTVYLFGTMA